MTDPALVDILSGLLAIETRGLSSHIAQISPYMSLPAYARWVKLKKLSNQAQEHAQQLSDVFDDLGLYPKAVRLDANIANYHYVGIDSLLPALIEERQQQLQAYSRAIHLAASRPRVQKILMTLEQENQDALALLQKV